VLGLSSLKRLLVESTGFTMTLRFYVGRPKVGSWTGGLFPTRLAVPGHHGGVGGGGVWKRKRSGTLAQRCWGVTPIKMSSTIK